MQPLSSLSSHKKLRICGVILRCNTSWNKLCCKSVQVQKHNIDFSLLASRAASNIPALDGLAQSNVDCVFDR